MDGTSVVIDELDITRTVVGPDKTQSPLCVDANAVLPTPVAAKRFEPISGRATQELQRLCSIQHLQLALSQGLKRTELSRTSSRKQRERVAASKGLDHSA
jgi:trehalose-6-phosphatase